MTFFSGGGGSGGGSGGGTWGSITGTLSNQTDLQTALDSKLESGDNVSTLTNDAGYITTYTVTESDVTQYEGSITITESQISDLGNYLENIVEDTTPQLGGTLDCQDEFLENVGMIELSGLSSQYTSQPDPFLDITADHEWNYSNLILPPAIQFNGTHTAFQNAFFFGMGFLFWNTGIVKNNTGSTNRILSSFYTLAAQTSFEADNDSVTMPFQIDILAQPTFTSSNGGSLSCTLANQFAANITVSAGATVASRNGFAVSNGVVNGTLTNNVGVLIENLTTGVNNTHILIGGTAAATGDWGIYQVDDSDSRLNGELSMNSHKITDVLDPTSDQDVATKKYVDDNSGGGGGGLTSAPAAFQATGSTNITNSATTLDLNTEVFDPDTNYTLASNTIAVTLSGYYDFSINIPVNDDGSTGGTRSRVFAWLERDQGSGTWVAIDNIRGQDYARETSGGEGVHLGGIVELSANEEVRVRVQQSGTVDLSTESGQSSLNVHRIRAS